MCLVKLGFLFLANVHMPSKVCRLFRCIYKGMKLLRKASKTSNRIQWKIVIFINSAEAIWEYIVFGCRTVNFINYTNGQLDVNSQIPFLFLFLLFSSQLLEIKNPNIFNLFENKHEFILF